MGFINDKEQFCSQFSADKFADFRRSYEPLQHPPETLQIPFEATEELLRQFIENDTAEKREFVEKYLPQLGYFLQGPFPLPGQKVSPSIWDCRGKFGNWMATGVIPKLKGAKALDVGCNSGYDCFLMKAFGASEVTGFEPYGFVHHARFINAVYEAGVRFLEIGWRDLNRPQHCDYDFVNCQGLLYHVQNPLKLLSSLAKVLRPGGTLLLETHVLTETSTMGQFIENSFWNDETYWWVLGDECVKAMLRSVGFTDVEMVSKMQTDSRNPEDPTKTIEGYDAGARAFFVATKKG